jgi:SLOG cluster4 family
MTATAADHAPPDRPLPRPDAAGAASSGPAGPATPTAYAGIGSQRTPGDVLELMRTIAVALARRGWVLRSGGAPGADQAFAAGARAAGGTIELYLPWTAFAGQAGAHLARPTRAAYRLAARHHPAWERLDGRARALHARNAHQVLGAGLDARPH